MGKIAFIYPGQGAQKCFMGQDFYDAYEECAKVYRMADEILDISVTELCFTENERINQTEFTQAALVTTCLAITQKLLAMGIKPDVTAGLSLGEYAAIATAGGFSIADAIKTVRARGIYMEEAVPNGVGAMAAVLGMDAEAIDAVVSPMKDVYVANYNCPGQIVITGKKEAVEAASAKLLEAGAKRCLPLNVSGPFHSPFLQGAGSRLADFMKDVELGELSIPYVTNVTAEYVTDVAQIKPYLERQVSSSVRWQQSVENMIADGVDTFVEIGPGKTLAGFIKKINKDVNVINVSQVSDIGAVECLKKE